jgi:hypothetical protein
MKENSETRSNTGTQGNNQSDQFDSNQMKGSQSSKDANRSGSFTARPDDQNQRDQKDQDFRSGNTQHSGSFTGQHANAGSTGTSGGQISPQTHDTANAGRSAGRGQGGSGAGSSDRSDQKP